MSFLTHSIHSSLLQMTKKSHREFGENRKNIQQIQTQILRRLLQQSSTTLWGREHGLHPDLSYEQLISKVTPTTWDSWAEWVKKQKAGDENVLSSNVSRYQPTSGSTFNRKWIPYSKEFLKEIDNATNVWMHDLYKHYPKIKNGRHYWSLSWLPNDLRQEMSNNDLSYFPWFKRQMMGKIMAVPDEIQHASSAELARDLTIKSLLPCSDLSMFFVWSPTFLLGICDEIWNERQELSKKCKGKTSEILSNAKDQNELMSLLWPKLSLISAWDTADAKPWANRLKKIFPNTAFQGKGLFATEGVVTIPYEGKNHLSYTSHFYEFMFADGRIVPSWDLKEGDCVSPLLSSGNGIWRYQLGDELDVAEIQHQCPILSFKGRKHTVDLVGEKLSLLTASEILRSIGPEAILFLASQGSDEEKPRYILVCEGARKNGLDKRVEEKLLQNHHYRLARELGQLDSLEVEFHERSGDFFKILCSRMGWVLGNMKWESIIKIPYKSSESESWKA
ncbi:MAG: GH3 auxin-responsive promoter family protein [Bacteriovoracaceae bacterium]|nr:GH3 auxin-responsive promoter family protein [Bacteriovoracaceae bacterium]